MGSLGKPVFVDGFFFVGIVSILGGTKRLMKGKDLWLSLGW